MRIMILNPTPRDPRGEANHDSIEALLRSYCSPGTQLDLCYPDDFEGGRVSRTMGAQGVLTGLNQAMATPAHLRKIVWAEQNGYDAVIQSNTFDPSVEVGRLAVRIPVLGMMRTTIHAAANLADRIGITVPLAGHVPHTRRILRSYGLEHFVTDIRPVGVFSSNMDGRKDELFNGAVETMRAIVRETSPECIIPLGGLLIPYIVDPADLAREVGVPVLNTKSITIRFAETCFALGMSHSPIAYPSAKLNLDDFNAYAFR